MRRLLLIGAALVAMSACNEVTSTTADQKAARQQEDVAARAQDEVGIYQPTHFTRKRLANCIGQMLDDPNLATISYSQSLDGRLHCIGHTIGFPLPGATQTTSPEKWEMPMTFYADGSPAPRVVGKYDGQLAPEAEPDQLFSPSTEDATWILLVNPQDRPSRACLFRRPRPDLFGKQQARFVADRSGLHELTARDPPTGIAGVDGESRRLMLAAFFPYRGQ